MDSTRISIARILALGVPLTWQDAVAVAQEAAMLSDVNAAMNSRPSLVSPETCVITRAGDLELPETTEIEDPDAVADLLRAMLGQSDVPEPLEALAFGASARDLSTDLAAFPVGNRRAVIARLATRALTSPGAPAAPAARTEPAASAAPAGPAAPAASAASAPREDGPAAATERPPAPIPFPAPATQAPPFVATPRPAVVVQPPPFVAAQAAASALPAAVVAQVPPIPAATRAPFPAPAPAAADAPPASAPRHTAPAPPAPDAELRRLRTRSVEREARNQRFVARVMRWLAWRPDSPDPRLLGGAAVVAAAIVSMLWRSGPAPSPADRAAASPSAVIAATTPPPAAAPPADRAPAALPASPGTLAAPGAAPGRAARPAAPRADAGDSSRGSAAVEAPRPAPETAAPMSAPPPAAATPILVPAPATGAGAGAAPPEPARRSAPSPAGTRGGRGRPTLYSANDADVAPPVMLRQQLPSSLLEPDSEVPPDWPYLELLIDETGAVERVRLRAKAPAPGQTLYRHRMLVAAAKAWQFEPAQLNGQPVRYVMRVPLEP